MDTLFYAVGDSFAPDRSTLDMQEPWIYDELVFWKKRHNISDIAFEELHAIQNARRIDPSGFYPSPPSTSTMLPDNSAAFGYGMYDIFPGSHNIQDSTHSYTHLVDSASDSKEQPVRFCEQESQQVILSTEHEVRSKRGQRGKSCATCWKNKRACVPTNDPNKSICQECSRLNLPAEMCLPTRLQYTTVFTRWRDTEHESKLSWENLFLDFKSPSLDITVRHISGGPMVLVECREYIPITGAEEILFHKTMNGWSSVITSPYCIAAPRSVIDLQSYVGDHVNLFLGQTAHSPWLSELLHNAKALLQDPLIWLTLNLWTAQKLLMHGWELEPPGSLGILPVSDSMSELYGRTPAPRVLQNQLDRFLERYCADTEKICLKHLQELFKNAESRRLSYTVAGLILHIRERDIWWLLSCTPGRNSNYEWRHPKPAITLIKENLHASNALIRHAHDAPGPIPDTFYMNILLAQSPQELPKKRYNWTDETSLDNSLCSMLFAQHKSPEDRVARLEDFDC